jgi:16S rRNA (cytosine967-C5)-methyltransferase
MARVHTRFRYLTDLWRDAAAGARPPQFDRWLATRFKGMKQLGRRDRRWYGDMAFACMRYAAYAAVAARWQEGDPVALERELAPDPEASWEAARQLAPEQLIRLVVAALAARGSLADAAGDEAVELAGLAAAEAERVAALDAALARDGSLAARCLSAGVPGWYAPQLEKRALRTPGFDPERFLAAQATRPPLWLRVADPRETARVIAELRERCPDAVEDGNGVIRVRGDVNITALAPFAEGRIEIQDRASQAIGSAVKAVPGDLVWDACAGGGGKSMQLAAALAGRGAVYASDVRAYKLDEVKRRAARGGFTNARLLPWSGERPPILPREVERHGGFDRVLVDAPCSAAGTWRRNPDARFRASAKALAELVALQGQILRRAESTVRDGGRLVYGTCSWLVDENEAVVEAFAAACPRWKIHRAELVGAPWLDSDTMFVAVLEP